jgi:hypothetical protein
MVSFQKPGSDGWRYGVSYRTRRDDVGDYTVQRWNGSEWETVGRTSSYDGARIIATRDSDKRGQVRT